MRVIIFPSQEKETTKPKDYKFMEESEQVLNDPPATWMKYPYSEDGLMSIIDMEYNELKEATTTEQKKHELIHVASACLHLWRKLSNVD